MQAITRYVANDGSEWETPEAAEAREALIEAVSVAMKALGDRPTSEGCRFDNGEGYRQHSLESIAKAKASLIKLSRIPLLWWMDEQEQKHNTNWDNVHPSWFCRMLDGGSQPLERAWARLWCIDSQGREWGQVYFAEHPHEASGQYPV